MDGKNRKIYALTEDFSEKFGRGSGTTFRHRKEKVTAVRDSYKEKQVRDKGGTDDIYE